MHQRVFLQFYKPTNKVLLKLIVIEQRKIKVYWRD